MKVTMAVLITSFALLVVALPVHAHHPFTAQFDPNQSVTMKGTVTRVEWGNPHAHIAMDVKDSNGETTNWEFELGGLKKLRDLGWKKDTVKTGDQITINGWKARDASHHISANMITLADGSKYPGGSSFFDRGKDAPVSN